MWSAADYDANPAGGVGGLGLVQLMAPPGDNLADQTNTILDDNIHFYLPGSTQEVTGLQKQQLLGWRGFADATGARFDDGGNPVVAVDGDIRPAPVLLPSPFNARSRVRSKWIDTGSSVRRQLATADNQPRGLVGGEQGPKYDFDGLADSPLYPGYVDYEAVGSSVRIRYPLVDSLGNQPIAELDANSSYLGEPAYRVRLASAVLGTPNQYVQYEAELLNQNGQQLTSFRVVSHDEQELKLDRGLNLLPEAATQLRLRRKFFRITTNGVEGLGGTYPDNGSVSPIANVRIGFALHFDPSSGNANDRFPISEQEFLRDFNDPDIADWLNTYHPGEGLPQFIQWDVLFDMAYAPSLSSTPPSLSPSTPRPTLDFLRIPFKF
ncbi:MAG: hypothetical protein H6835_19035 [Planctomycetes bacterium]|nr:hypothetical protein [Planctomycetota bacterium]